jgi:hypothetical protein
MVHPKQCFAKWRFGAFVLIRSPQSAEPAEPWAILMLAI